MKELKTKSPPIDISPKLIILILVTVGLLVWRFDPTGADKTDSKVELEAVLLDEPKVYERWQYFSIEGHSVKTSSEQVYEYADLLAISGTVEEGRLDAPEIKIAGRSRFHKILFEIRSNLKEKIFRALPQPQASFLAGILLGAREDLPEEFRDQLIKTGTIHVVVVSGYNIAVVGGFLAGLARFINRRIATILAVLGIISYTLLVGADPPAVRAAIMGSLAFLAVFSGRQRFSLYSLFLAGFLMLFINPLIITSISFQLSFMATAGIIFFQKNIFEIVKKVPKPINEDLATTLSAQILVVPLIFYHFGSVSLVSPLVNSLVLWVIPLSTIVGFVFLVVSFVIWPLSLMISWVLWALTSIFIFVVDLFSNLNITYFEFEPNNLFPIVFYYLAIAMGALYLKYGRLAKS